MLKVTLSKLVFQRAFLEHGGILTTNTLVLESALVERGNCCRQMLNCLVGYCTSGSAHYKDCGKLLVFLHGLRYQKNPTTLLNQRKRKECL